MQGEKKTFNDIRKEHGLKPVENGDVLFAKARAVIDKSRKGSGGNGMITLEAEEKCEECPLFEAGQEKEIMYADNKPKICNTRIYCKNRWLCQVIEERLKKENEN